MGKKKKEYVIQKLFWGCGSVVFGRSWLEGFGCMWLLGQLYNWEEAPPWISFTLIPRFLFLDRVSSSLVKAASIT